MLKVVGNIHFDISDHFVIIEFVERAVFDFFFKNF